MFGVNVKVAVHKTALKFSWLNRNVVLDVFLCRFATLLSFGAVGN
jgi:hypothetical protein